MTQIIHKSSLNQLDIPDLSLGDYILQQYNQNPELLRYRRDLEFPRIYKSCSNICRRISQKRDRGWVCCCTHRTQLPGFRHLQYTSREIHQQLCESNPLITITTSEKLDAIVEATTGTSVKSIILLDGCETKTESNVDGSQQLNISYWSDCLESPQSQQPLDARSTVAVLPFSSGTTGIPKGVMLSHFNLVANVMQTNSAQRFDMEAALALIEKHRVTRFFAVPPIVLGLAKHSAIDQYDISSLQQVFSGAAPLGGDIAEEAAKRINCPVVQGYGMTELSPVSHITVGDDYKAGSSGVAVANTECRIVDEKGNDQPYGEIGELWIRGPQVMMGYHNNKTATQECLDDDGWLHTGDIARIDEDGHMTIVDRLKELIKYKGFQIAPAELEATIVSYPEVADVAVIGVADSDSGEAPKAFIKLQKGKNLSMSELNQRLATELSRYKQIALS